MTGTMRTPQLVALIESFGYCVTVAVERSTFTIWTTDLNTKIGNLHVDDQGAYSWGIIRGRDVLDWIDFTIELQQIVADA
jgi:hypothetical protein